MWIPTAINAKVYKSSYKYNLYNEYTESYFLKTYYPSILALVV